MAKDRASDINRVSVEIRDYDFAPRYLTATAGSLCLLVEL